MRCVIRTWLKTLRKSKNLTQAALAQVLGVSARTVQEWESGVNNPVHATLYKLANVLGDEVHRHFAAESKAVAS